MRVGNALTAGPRLLAMLCILAVFVPAFFMQGAARALFVPLALAVGFAMIAVLHSFQHVRAGAERVAAAGKGSTVTHANRTISPAKPSLYARFLGGFVRLRWLIVPAYSGGDRRRRMVRRQLARHRNLSTSRCRTVPLRLRGPDGTHFEKTKQITLDVLDEIGKTVGKEKIDVSLGYVGIDSDRSYPVNALYQWSRGPEEGLLLVSFQRGSGVVITDLQRRSASAWPSECRGAAVVRTVGHRQRSDELRLADADRRLRLRETIFGECASSRKNWPTSFPQHSGSAAMCNSRNRSTTRRSTSPVDREKARTRDVVVEGAARSLVAATGSTRFTVPMYWPDPKSGIGFRCRLKFRSAELDRSPISPTYRSRRLTGRRPY